MVLKFDANHKKCFKKNPECKPRALLAPTKASFPDEKLGMGIIVDLFPKSDQGSETNTIHFNNR